MSLRQRLLYDQGLSKFDCKMKCWLLHCLADLLLFSQPPLPPLSTIFYSYLEALTGFSTVPSWRRQVISLQVACAVSLWYRCEFGLCVSQKVMRMWGGVLLFLNPRGAGCLGSKINFQLEPVLFRNMSEVRTFESLRVGLLTEKETYYENCSDY